MKNCFSALMYGVGLISVHANAASFQGLGLPSRVQGSTVGLQKFPATDRRSGENGLMAQTPTGQTRLSGQAKPEVSR
jgi:hypothetical protein